MPVGIGIHQTLASRLLSSINCDWITCYTVSAQASLFNCNLKFYCLVLCLENYWLKLTVISFWKEASIKDINWTIRITDSNWTKMFRKANGLFLASKSSKLAETFQTTQYLNSFFLSINSLINISKHLRIKYLIFHETELCKVNDNHSWIFTRKRRCRLDWYPLNFYVQISTFFLLLTAFGLLGYYWQFVQVCSFNCNLKLYCLGMCLENVLIETNTYCFLKASLYQVEKLHLLLWLCCFSGTRLLLCLKVLGCCILNFAFVIR